MKLISITLSLPFLFCAIFKPYYPNAGVVWSYVDNYQTQKSAQKYSMLTEAQLKKLNKAMISKAAGISRIYGKMFERPPRGFERPGQGRVVVEFLINPDGSAQNVKLVSNTFNFAPVEKRLIKIVDNSKFRGLDLSQSTLVAYQFRFTLDVYE